MLQPTNHAQQFDPASYLNGLRLISLAPTHQVLETQ